jgi:hypothetical protein
MSDLRSILKEEYEKKGEVKTGAEASKVAGVE